MFPIPYGPVRSGIFEAIQFLIEIGGEDIPKVGHHHAGRAGRLLLHGIAPQMIEAAEVPVLVVGEQAT